MSATRNFLTEMTAANRGALRSATALGRVLTVAAAASAMGGEGVKAGPKGGVVKAGNATITTRGGTTTINQAGQKVVIDWDSFDIDANDAVNFLQPGKNSIALNRVLNDLPTNIRGQLTANGNVWIVNQHGVTFHAGAMVNVGSLIATTADIDNADFMAGNYKFDKPGDPNAKIINEGDITFGEAGLAAFVAPSATNRGVIAGRMGKVVIAGNETFAVDLAGDGMWAFTMGEGANAASASNSGRIHNPGGYILISARAAQGMVDSNISVGGVVEATTARVEGGKIVLSGDGFVEVSGELDATGSEAGQVGGSIEVTGDKVHVTATAKIDASGEAGGGSIKIGGDYQGGGSLKTASRTLVGEGAEIAASVIGQVGDGGEVIVWADEITGFFGSIRATGGANAGDGGFAEVSGKQQLAFDGMVDLSARNGLPGTLLLDPDEIVISAVGTDDVQLGDGQILFGDGGAYSTFNISTGTIETQLNAGTDVLLQANNTITLEAGNPITATGAGNLTLNASSYGLYLNSDVTIAGDLSLTTGGVIAPANGVTLSARDIALYTNGDQALGSITTSRDLIVQSSSGGVTDTMGETINVTGSTSITAQRDILLDNATNVFGGAVSLSGEDIQLTGNSDLTLGTITANANGADTLIAGDGDVVLGGGAIVFGGALTGVDELTATSTGAITQSAAITAADLATFNTSAGSVTLTQAGNAFGSVAVDTTFTGTTSADVSITEVDATALGLIDANALTVSSDGGISEAAGAVINADGATSLTSTSTIDLRIQDTHTFGGLVTLSGTQIVEFALAGGATFGNITATNGGNVENRLTSSIGAVALNGAVSIAGTSDLYLRSGGTVTQTGAITADQLRFAGGSFALTGANDVASLNTPVGPTGAVTFNDINGVDLAGVNATALTVTAGAAITDSAANTISGAASLSAPGIDFTLDQASNTFGSLSLAGANVSVLNLTDLVLGSVDLSDALVVNVTGGVTQGATSVAVGGTTSITAADDIVLASSLNEFSGVVTLSGEDISIANAATVTLNVGAITAASNTPADATLMGDGDVTVAGGAIVFGGALTGVDDLTVNAAGAVSQTAALSLTGALDVNATGQNVSLNNASNDFNDVDVLGAIVSLSDTDDIALGAITVSDLTVNAGGAIAEASGAVIDVDGPADLTTTGNIDIRIQNTHSFDGAVTLSAAQIVDFATSNGVTFGDVTATDGANAENRLTSSSGVMALNGAISIAGTSDLYLRSGGAIAQTGAITADQLRLSGGAVKTLSGANDVNSLATPGLAIGTLVFNDTDGVDLAAVSGSTVTITAAGDISDSATNTITAATSITATGATILLDETGNTFGTLGLNATQASVQNIADLELGDVNVATLTVNASGSVTQSAPTSLTVTTSTSITTTDDILLTNTANAVAGSLTLSGEDINLDAGGNVTLGAITASNAASDATIAGAGDVTISGGAIAFAGPLNGVNDLDVIATGDITQTAAVSVSGDADFSAPMSQINLSNASNDFQGQVDASASAVTLYDANDLELGLINADTLVANAGDDITDRGAKIEARNAASFTATGDIDIDALDTHVFTSGVDLSADQIIDFAASGTLSLGTVTATNMTDVVNRITATDGITLDGVISTAGISDLTLVTTNSDVLKNAGSLSTDVLTVDVGTGDATFITPTIALNTLRVTSGANVSLTLPGGVTIGSVDATTLTVNTGNAIAQEVGSAIVVDGLADFTTTGDTVTLAQGGNDFGSVTVDTTSGMSAAADVAITETNSAEFGDISAASLTITAGGAITQAETTTITATGTTTLSGTGFVTLEDATNDFAAVTGSIGSVALRDANALTVEALTATAGSVSISSAGNVTVAANANISATDDVTLTSTLAGSTVSVTGTTQITADSDADVDGDVTLRATGGTVQAISAAAAISGANVALDGGSVTSSATITATAGGVDVDATGAAALNGAVTATTAGSTVTIDAGGDITVTTIDAVAISAETTNGAITQTGGTITTAAGTDASDFAATGNVTLDQTGNNFGGPTALSGQSVTIRDTDALILDDVTAMGTFVVNAGGAVNQNGTSSVTVTETATVTATGQNIDLSNDNDFRSTFGASGADVQVTDINALELGAITASTLTVDAGGAVSQSASATVTNETAVTATGQSVDLDNAANAFTGVVNVTGGTVEVVNNGALGLGDITASSLTASTPTGAITNAADDVLSVTGTTSITATTGSVTIASNGMNSENLRQTVTVTAGGEISLTGVNSQKLVLGDLNATAAPITVDVANQAIDLTGNVDTGGDTLTLRSAGDITQQAGQIAAGEAIVSSGGNAVTLEAAGNQISTLTLGANGAVSVVTGSNVAIGQEAMGGQSTLTLKSTGDITQASSLTVTNNAGFITSGGSVTLNATGNAFGSVSADTSADMSSPNQVIITEADATVISGITASSATVTSGGPITQTGKIDASANGSFTATGDITLTDATNDFADTGSGSTAAFSGGTVAVTDIDTLALGAVTSSASATITADDAGASGNFSGGLNELRFFDTDGDMVLSSALVLPTTVVNFTADSVGAIEAQSLTLPNANTLLDATTSVTFSTGAGSFASLTVNAPDGVYQTAPIAVTGAADLNAPGRQIALGNSANDFQGRVDADASGIVLFDASDLELALINSDTLVANAGGDITDQGAKIEARNYASFTATDDIIIDTLDTHVFNGAVALSADQITRFAATGSVSLGPLTATNMTDVVNRITVTDGVTLDGAISTAGLSDLTLDTTNGDVLQQSGSLTTDGLTLNLGTGDGTFTAGANDINTLTVMSATDVALTDTDGLSIGDVNATTLTVTAGDTIDQVAGSTIALTGLADLTATSGNIALDQVSNDFATINADGADLTFTDANDVVLGDIEASGALSVDALTGSISDGDTGAAGQDVNVAGTTTLSAMGAVTLDDATNDFGQAVAAAGVSVTLRDANSIVLGDIDTAGALIVDAVTGAITQDGDGAVGEDINAATASLTATTNITLNDASNDFAGEVNAAASAVTLNDINTLELGDIDATTLMASANSIDDGAPAMSADADINVTGTATLTARTGDITLDDATNTFGVVNADGAAVTLTDRDAIELGDVDATTLVVSASTIDDGAAGIAGGDVNVTGTTTLTASTTITLDDATNDFGGAVAASGTAISLGDANSIVLGDIDAGGTLTVEAVTGAITQDGGGAVGEDINVAAAATFSAAGAITLTDASNDFQSTVNADGGAVSIVDLNAIELADIDANALTVAAVSIEDGDAGMAGEDINVATTTALTASTTITLDDATNDFGGAVSANGEAITLRDADSIILGDIDAGGALIVEAVAGAITQNGGGAVGEDINAATTATFTATDAITLTDASNDFMGAVNTDGAAVSLVDLNAIELADIDANSLTVAAASINDGAAGAAGEDINVTGATALTASTTITLDDATNDFGGAVSASGAAITLRDANSIILGDIDAGGVLTVDAVSGAISQNGDGQPGEDINAAVEATFTASTTITLTDASNDFAGEVNADGTDIALRDINAIELGDIDAATLAVTAGAIDDGVAAVDAQGDIDVTGTTTLTSVGAITLDDATNDFGQAVSAQGAAITLQDKNNIVLGEIAATGPLTVTARGSLTDSAGAAIIVDGATTLTAEDGASTFDIALDNDTAADRHDFRGAVNAVGQDITLIDRNGITLGTVTTNGGAADNTINADGGAEATDPGALIVIARGGAITQEMGNALTVTGDTTLEAADGAGGYFDITLTNTQNAFDSDNADALGDGNAQTDFVTFLGETVSINDTGPFFVFDSVANAGGVLTAQTGDLTIDQVRVNAAIGPFVGIAQDGAIDADILSGGSITLGGAGSTDGAATAATGVITVDNFAVDALAVASDISTTLTNGDAGAGLKVAAPLQTFTFVTADAFTDGVATDFNALTGSTADQLILERIAFDGDITIAAGDVDLGHIDADDGFFVTALTGDVTKRADADLDFVGSASTGFSVSGARGAADQTVALQGFDTLLRVGGAASFTATSGDVIITRGQSGGGAKEVDLQGPVSIAATDAAIEDQNSVVLGQVAVDNNLAIRINSDNANAGAETLTQTATQTITVGGDLALITGDGATERSDVTLTTADNDFNTVSAIAGTLSIRGGADFTLRTSDLTGGLTIGTAAAQHGGDLVLQDVQLGGDLAFDVTGATTLNRLNVASIDGQSGSAAVNNLGANGAVNLTTTGGDLTVTDAIIGAFDFDSAGALTVTNLSTAGSDAGLSTAVGDITVANIVSASNARFDSTGGALDIDSARIGSTLTLSASGDVTLGAIATGADLSVTSDTASVLIRDAATEAPADIVVDGVQGADIGFASGPLIGDIADARVVETVAGTAGQTVDPDDFTLQLAIGGDAAITAAGSILLPREAASEGGFQNDFMGDVALSAATGDVVIEDANALSFATVTITAGDLSARSNADNTGAGEGITQTAAIAVGGEASFITGDHGGAAIADEAVLADVTLSSQANDFTGAVSVVAGNAVLADANSITVANTRVAGALTIDTTTAGATDIAALRDTQSGGTTTITSAGAVDLDRASIGGALIATSEGAGLTASDLAVTGATTLTAETTLTVDDALLADARITAGASGSLSDVSARVINVETGGVTISGLTISGLTAATTTITSTGPADIEKISTGATTITTTESSLALSQAEVTGPLTARTGTGDIALADVNVTGDATLDGGAIGSDPSGNGETRLRVTGALDLDGADIDLTDLSILGAAALDATGSLTLDDASFADLAATSGGALTITDAGAATTTLNSGAALNVTNMRIGALDADTGGASTLQAVQIAGGTDILATTGDIRLGSVQVGGSLDAEATSGSVTTVDGPLTLGEVTVAAPVAVTLSSFNVEGARAAAIGVEAALANSPATEARVVDAVTAIGDQTAPALAGDQATGTTLPEAQNAQTLAVAGATTITAADDLTLNDADLADATLTAGDEGILTTIAAENLSVSTGGMLTASVLKASDTTIVSGGPTDLEDLATAKATITVADAVLLARRIETNGSLAISTGTGNVAISDLNVSEDLVISGASIDAHDQDARETRAVIGGSLDVIATGDVGLVDLVVAGATDIDAGDLISLEDASLAAAKLRSDDGIELRNAQLGDTTLNANRFVVALNSQIATLDADAGSFVLFDDLQIGGDASVLGSAGDVSLGSVMVAGTFAVESADGNIRTINSDFGFSSSTITAPTAPATPGFGAAAAPVTGSAQPISAIAPAAPATQAGEASNTLLSVGGDAYFLASGDIVLVDDEVGVTGDNDFMGGVTAISGGSVMLNDANDLIIGAPTGVATPGGETFATTGITAAESLRIEAGGSITDADAPQAVIALGGDALMLAGGDVLLDNETHAIGGAIAATGQNITLTETGSINLGPINASGDLMVEAGANNAAAGGTTGDAAILQDRAVDVANAAIGEAAEVETIRGAIRVAGASTFATGLAPGLSLANPQVSGDRRLVLDSPANQFGGRLNVARIAGDATITENSQPGAMSGEQTIGNFEIGGTTRLTTTDNIIFIGRMTSLLDQDDPGDLPTRPSEADVRNQGNLNIADEDLHLFIATGEELIIDTRGVETADGTINPDGANVRFDGFVDGDNDVLPLGGPSIIRDREGLGGLTINAGAEGEIRFRDFVGAVHPLGDVNLSAGDIFAGFTFADDQPVLTPLNFTPDNRFLFDRFNQDDFFFARNLEVRAQRRIEFLTPFRTVENFILLDQYFGVNISGLVFGGLESSAAPVGPEVVQAFGFIGNDRSRATGLFPRGPQGGNFQFNDCVIGDVADCTNIPIPNVINNILTPAPPLLGIDTEDLLELFGSFGNEELWGVPQSYYSDLGDEPENKADCPEGSDDAACRGS